MVRLTDTEASPADDPVRCVLYLRVSSDEQAERGLSIPKQRQDLTDYAARVGYVVVGEYEDAAKSAFEDRSRPAYEQMLADAQAGARAPDGVADRNRLFDAILVADSSRFSRYVAGASRDKDLLLRCGVTVEYPGLVLDRASPGGRFTDDVLQAKDEMQSRQLRHHSVRSCEYFLGRGLAPGGRSPYGYVQVKHRHVIVEDEAKVVRLMVGWRLSEGLSCVALAHRLNEQGHQTRGGNAWTDTSIHNLLTNPCLYGDIVFRQPTDLGTRSLVHLPDAHEPIITRDEQRRIGLKMRLVAYDSRKSHLDRGIPVKKNQKHVLTGLLHCMSCGGHYVDRSPSRKDYFYYYCRNRACKERRFRSDEIEETVFQHVLRYVLRGKIMAEMWEVRRRELDESLAAGRLDAVAAEIEALDAKIGRLLDQVEGGEGTPSLTRRLREREAERKGLTDEYARLQDAATRSPAQTPFGEDFDLVYEWIDAVKAVLQSHHAIRNVFIRRVVERIEVPPEPEPLKIVYHPVVPVPAHSKDAPPEAWDWMPVFRLSETPNTAVVVEMVDEEGKVRRLDETGAWLRD